MGLTVFEIPNIESLINSSSDIAGLTTAIVATAGALLREANRLFKPHGITAVQFNVLTLLSDVPRGLRPCDLTAALVVDPSSTTYVLDRMEAVGWLRRVDDADDRRAWRIVLTPAGRTLHTRVMPLYRAALRETMRSLSVQRVVPLTEALREIQNAAAAAVESVLNQPTVVSRKARRSHP